MPLVFRVENDKGNGPYGSDAFPECWSMMNDHGDSYHLSPAGCPILKGIKLNENCGCDTADNLLEWFSINWMLEMSKHGFGVSIYSHPRVRVGKNGQALFVKQTATLKDRLSIADFLSMFADLDDLADETFLKNLD